MPIQFEEYRAQAERWKRLAEMTQDTRLKQQYDRLSECFAACARNRETRARLIVAWGRSEDRTSLSQHVAEI